MTLEIKRDDVLRKTLFELEVKDSDLHAVADKSVIIPMIQSRLAVAVVDKIMERVGPLLDEIFKGEAK